MRVFVLMFTVGRLGYQLLLSRVPVTQMMGSGLVLYITYLHSPVAYYVSKWEPVHFPLFKGTRRVLVV